jgi:hypothetical protein
MKIVLEMDRERAILLMRACETIARLGMGQFKELAEMLAPMKTWQQKENMELFLKKILLSELTSNSYNSIHSSKVPEECQVAWDCYQHIRREISWFDKGKDFRTDERDWKTMGLVIYDNPMKVSKLKGDFKTKRIK